MNCRFSSSHLHATRPHVGINTSISNILLCNILINYTRTYHKVTSLLGVNNFPYAVYGHKRTKGATRHNNGITVTVLLSTLSLSTTEVTVRAYHEWLLLFCCLCSPSLTTEVTVRAYHESCFRCGTNWLDGYDAGRFIGIMVRPQTHLRISDYDGLATRNYYDTISFQSISGKNTFLEEADKEDTLITIIC